LSFSNILECDTYALEGPINESLISGSYCPGKNYQFEINSNTY